VGASYVEGVVTLDRHFDARWDQRRRQEAIGEALAQATDAAIVMDHTKAAFMAAAREWAEAEEWVATVRGFAARADAETERDPLIEAAREARDSMRNMAIHPMTVQPNLLREMALKLDAALGESDKRP
jgi:arginase family enzyme